MTAAPDAGDDVAPAGATADGAPRTDPTHRRASRVIAAAARVAPLVLVVVAEAAWVSVVAGLFQEFALHGPMIGIPGLFVFVAVGVVAARVIGPRLGDRWPGFAFGLVVMGAIAGWLAAPEARSALEVGLGPALAAHPGGLLAGVAVLRGFAHARLPLAESTVTHLLAIGVPGLAVAALLGGVIGDPFRNRFLADALGSSIVFVAATVLALAFARLEAIGSDERFDWRRNPPWLVLTVGLLVGAIAMAIPLSLVAGTALSIFISLALGPMLIVGLAMGFDRTARRVLLYLGLVAIVIYLFVAGPGAAINLPTAPPGSAGHDRPTPAEQLVAASLGGLLLLGAVVGILLLIAVWMRRTPSAGGGLDEIRTIDASSDGPVARRRRGRFGRRRDPATAAEAYVALIEDLDRHPDVRREAAETPAGHASRLRSSGRTELQLELLAADYALVRFGGLVLAAAEDRRGVGRWRVLRRRLAIRLEGARPTTTGESVGPDAAPPEDVDVRRTM